MNTIHWNDYYNNHPRLLRMIVQVKTQNIPNLFGAPWSPKNQIRAAHILCLAKNEKDTNIQMGGMYNKKRKASLAATDLPEARLFRYDAFKVTYNISQIVQSNAKLQKSRLIQQWALEQHHSIPFWGLVNIYKVLTVPNGHGFTIRQVIMSTKFVHAYIYPLFIGVYQSPEGDVVIICDVSMKEKAKALLSLWNLPCFCIWLCCVGNFYCVV